MAPLAPLSDEAQRRLIALNPLAQAEGWDIFDCDDGGLQLQKLDDSDRFEDDASAWAFVVAGAEAGNPLHMEALAILQEYEPIEFKRVMSARAREG